MNFTALLLVSMLSIVNVRADRQGGGAGAAGLAAAASGAQSMMCLLLMQQAMEESDEQKKQMMLMMAMMQCNQAGQSAANAGQNKNAASASSDAPSPGPSPSLASAAPSVAPAPPDDTMSSPAPSTPTTIPQSPARDKPAGSAHHDRAEPQADRKPLAVDTGTAKPLKPTALAKVGYDETGKIAKEPPPTSPDYSPLRAGRGGDISVREDFPRGEATNGTSDVYRDPRRSDMRSEARVEESQNEEIGISGFGGALSQLLAGTAGGSITAILANEALPGGIAAKEAAPNIFQFANSQYRRVLRP